MVGLLIVELSVEVLYSLWTRVATASSAAFGATARSVAAATLAAILVATTVFTADASLVEDTLATGAAAAVALLCCGVRYPTAIIATRSTKILA